MRTELFAFWYWIEAKCLGVQAHVEAGVAQSERLLLLARLAPDEVDDVGMVDVEHDHLGRATGLAARLDRARPGVGPAHEGTGPEAKPPLERCSLEAADLRQVDPRPRAATEDLPLLGVPVEDRLDPVLDREDQAGGALRVLLEAHVEPDRRVEGRHLVEQDVGELVLEGGSVGVRGEVVALTTPGGDGAGDAADHLLDGRLALVRVRAGRGSTSGRRCWWRSGTRWGNSTPRCSKAGIGRIADEGVADVPLDAVDRMPRLVPPRESPQAARKSPTVERAHSRGPTARRRAVGRSLGFAELALGRPRPADPPPAPSRRSSRRGR